MEIKRANNYDLEKISQISSENFSGLRDIKDARQWVSCNFSAFPRMQYFVAEDSGVVTGYILWMEKGGFRKESVFELEQIAVDKNFQGQGVGTFLIEKSFSEIKNHLEERGAKIKSVEVTTGTDNRAQNLYKKTLGANPECVIKDFFRGDE
ncbi:MAG TPA: GNAT family N-acetyltransferase, partial [Candidatus Staskawiczbacteria bacterium]|nr:GNAT family N-acetyltransferase [Candidatus Staskawiczbacteria bacterium]